MRPINSILVLLAALLAVFAEAAFGGIRHVLGAQIDLLPALVVYAALFNGTAPMAAVAVLGGLAFDSLSANPWGVSVLPLFLIGFIVSVQHELILRDEPFAQAVLGFLASAAAPALTVLLLLSMGRAPLIGWGSVWQWMVMSIGGGLAAPVVFMALRTCDRALNYRRATELSFRSDREIRRGRN